MLSSWRTQQYFFLPLILILEFENRHCSFLDCKWYIIFSSAEILRMMNIGREIVKIFVSQQHHRNRKFSFTINVILQVKKIILEIILEFVENSDYGNRKSCPHLKNECWFRKNQKLNQNKNSINCCLLINTYIPISCRSDI